jgi:hypothetical protein
MPNSICKLKLKLKADREVIMSSNKHDMSYFPNAAFESSRQDTFTFDENAPNDCFDEACYEQIQGCCDDIGYEYQAERVDIDRLFLKKLSTKPSEQMVISLLQAA